MRILGIETSCDETAAAVIEGQGAKIKVLSNIVSSQIEIHKKYGGVVPEVAAREHVLNILPVINEALENAGIKKDAVKKKINVIAVTTGPGLITSLQVGVETAKVLSYVWKIPVIAVNHIEGHIYANFIGGNIEETPQVPLLKGGIREIKFPALILTVSGGHTMLVLMEGHGKYKVIGETVDDAAGEAFDKAAAMMKLGYPGGPIISKYAKKFKINKSPIPNPQSPIILPRTMMYSKNFNFSFSGLKTALLYKIQKDQNWKKKIPEYCFKFQQAVIDVLIYKTTKAAENYNIKTIMLSGGVAANKELRKQMAEAIKNKLPNSQFQIPDFQYTTDNAAMIAAAGYFKVLRKKFIPWQKLRSDSNLELK